jgi:hypothetical protein
MPRVPRCLFLLMMLNLILAAPAMAKKACAKHGGAAGCDPNGFALCQDGAVDRAFHCEMVHKRKPQTKEIKFKKAPDRGQIQKPGEPPPVDTLEQSYHEMKSK